MANGKKKSYHKKLRQRAEDFIYKHPSAIRKIPTRDIKAFIEDLQIHQVELEMQNEELRRFQLELARPRDKYRELYDFAPVGYISVSDRGLILDANLTGAAMLGIERRRLAGMRFSRFIAGEDQAGFYRHRQKLFETQTKQVCELKLKNATETEFFVQLESIPVNDEAGKSIAFRTSLSDITDRKQAEAEREKLIAQLQEALENVKTIKGLLPICSSCKKIRDKGDWNRLERYLKNHSDVEFSHGICPECAEKLYGDFLQSPP